MSDIRNHQPEIILAVNFLLRSMYCWPQCYHNKGFPFCAHCRMGTFDGCILHNLHASGNQRCGAGAQATVDGCNRSLKLVPVQQT